MILESKDICQNDMNNEIEEAKHEQGYSKETDNEISTVISHKFRPKKRRMGNLILKTSSFVRGKTDNGNARENGEGYEYSDRTQTFGGALSGMLSKIFHTTLSGTSVEVQEKINPGYLNTRLPDELGERKLTKRGISRIFETYRKRNDLKMQNQCEEYTDSGFEREKDFNRFSKLEQALDAKEGPNILRSMNHGSNGDSCYSKNLSMACSLTDNIQVNSEDCLKAKLDTQLLLNDFPKTESEVLEDTVFSPNTHRPSLRDIPAIENIEISSTDQEAVKSHSTLRTVLKKISNRHVLHEKSSGPQDLHFSNIEDEIDSHLYYHSRRNLLFKCFPSKILEHKDNMRQNEDENTDFAPDLESEKQIPEEQIPTVPTTPNSLSDSFTVIKGILQQRYRSSFARSKNKRRDLSVRFVSPILSPIQMTNNEDNETEPINTEIPSRETE